MHNLLNKHNVLLPSFLSGLLIATLLYSSPSHAEPTFEVKHAETILVDNVYHINASLKYRFSEEALNALKNGVPLIILLDIEVEKKRGWWWVNKNIATPDFAQ